MNFDHFFELVHGYAPFPWQSRAARTLCSEQPPEAIVVPTASGKMAALDMALFAAAQGGPRRIFYVIDRRIVVDQAYDHAKQLVAAIESRDELRSLRDRLGPINVVRLRGGVQGDDDWVLHPERTSLILTTVDQVGSRLLHRGYGVSSRMWPLHAGFVGHDALYLLDEAHLLNPFCTTLQRCRQAGAAILVISLTATPLAPCANQIQLEAADLAHPVLQRRLCLPKPTRLEEVDDQKAMVKRMVELARECQGHAGQVIAIVVNLVKTARAVHGELAKMKGCSASLLTGRIRPYDRERLLAGLLPLMKVGRQRSDSQPTHFIVTTQTIEVGADLDFDVLISEAAPLSALRQRFGRLNRIGAVTRCAGYIIACRKGQLDQPDKAPVYGRDVKATWDWLLEHSIEGCLDMASSTMAGLLAQSGGPEEREEPACPLLPPHLHLLTQTGPSAPRLSVAPWLHGSLHGNAEVNLVWRADLTEANVDGWPRVLALMPPRTEEALSIPLCALRQHLAGKRESAEVNDVESALKVEVPADPATVRPVLIWRGAEDIQVAEQAAIQPGDTVVLPASYGGYDAFGWLPGSHQPVADVAEAAIPDAHPFAVRLLPEVLGWLTADIAQEVLASLAAIRQLQQTDEPDPEVEALAWQHFWQQWHAIDHPHVVRLGENPRVELLPRGAVVRQNRLQEFAGALSGDVAIELEPHSRGVQAMAAQLAQGHPHANQLEQAGYWHDQGKRALVMQRALHGDPVRAVMGPLLAKSGHRSRQQERQRLREAGFPRRFRHELHSLQLAREQGLEPLVLYLVGTHHGHGRPWFPLCADGDAPGADEARLEAHWAEQFARLQHQLGPWRLAHLELLLRAADIRRSIDEQEGRV